MADPAELIERVARIAAFLAARVGPSVRASGSAFGVDWTLGFNACRDIVLKGKE